MRNLLIGLLAAGLAWAYADLEDSLFDDLNHPAIEYRRREARDAVALLSERLRTGELRLKREGPSGYLKSLLGALEIPISSQVSVFSKSSVQMERIEPRNPRTLFFNDSVIAGWVHGGFIELAAQDPQQGVIFYILEELDSAPALVRSDSCLACHETYASVGVPGVFLRSVFPTATGAPKYDLGSINVDHRTPFEKRWGGYHLTGRSAPPRHMANSVLASERQTELRGELLADLKMKFDTSAYLSPYADVVSLMVFDHQMHGMNLLTRAGWEVRAALFEQQSKNGRRDLDSLLPKIAREVVDYFLFIDEAPLGGAVEGSSGFTTQFSARGPFDQKHRTLREFDLKTRLFRYPLSYLIYSPAFDGLPKEARAAIYQRLRLVLSGAETSGRYQKLSTATRQAIIEILRDTKPEFR